MAIATERYRHQCRQPLVRVIPHAEDNAPQKATTSQVTLTTAGGVWPSKGLTAVKITRKAVAAIADFVMSL
ncbi:hypothetical protein WT27_12640 [Burkholderia territorii]|uniref:Uncharacterized protein n=1 Tax=Burkholderia territorii TaxID=1503055 RepID=A0A125A9A7_9BURK|nr:hypothetical protein WT27_12640 [Burkholderia territorii]KVX33721.1 hypothetical protein WT31_08545 [Burkholderia territorii]